MIDRRSFLAGLAAMFAMAVPRHATASGLPLIELPVKPRVPVLSLMRLGGGRFDLADSAGRVTVVNFWATWCAPCRKELLSLEKAWQTLDRGRVQLVAVNLGGTPDVVERFLRRYEVTFPVLLDPRSATYVPWQIQGLPTTYVVGPDGRIHYGAIGDRDWSDPELLKRIIDLGNEGERGRS